MPAFRHLVLGAMFVALASHPALAETCHLTVAGRLVLDDEPCAVSARGGVLTIKPETGVALVIRGSTLLADAYDQNSRTVRHPRRNRLKSYGLVVKSDSNDDKTCYFNRHAVLCIER